MKIGDEVYIHGYVDEIRKDTVIIRNDGGYFGTIPSEIIDREQEPKTDSIKALGEEMRKVRGGIKDKKALAGFNMAVAICNKYLGEIEG